MKVVFHKYLTEGLLIGILLSNENRVLPYLTLPSGWAGYYTCPALRPYQFGPMRNPDVTRRSQWSAVKPKSAAKPNKSPATWDWWHVVWLSLSGGLRLV